MVQNSLFNLDDFGTKDDAWKEEWKDMPEFIQEDLQPFKSIYVHFENIEDMRKFSKLVEQTITIKTQSIWFPKAKIAKIFDKYYGDENDS